jgi:DNA polymerase-3 subunit gamma/tau
LLPSASPEDVWPVADFVARVAPETVQLFYQLVIAGRRDLALAPSARIGFEMCLLRLLAFQPQPADGARLVLPSAADGRADLPVQRAITGPDPSPTMASAQRSAAAATRSGPISARPLSALAAAPMPLCAALEPMPASAVAAAEPTLVPVSAPATATALDSALWAQFNQQSALRGPTREFAANLLFVEDNGRQLRFGISADQQHLQNDLSLRGLRDALARWLGRELSLSIETMDAAADTPAALAARARREQQTAAETALQQNPFVQRALNELNARIVIDTIQAIDASTN